MKTPKVLWQTWKTKTLPPNLRNYRSRWLESHPDYRHVLLDDEDLRNIVKICVPEYLEKYDAFTQNIERVDFARYALLYKYGGVYADLDTVPLKKIDRWVSEGRPVIGCEPREHAETIYKRKKVLCNALMISPPGEKVWKDLMNYIIQNYEKNYKPVENTGPMAMTRLYEKHPELWERVLITNPCVFYPLTGGSEKGKQKVSADCHLERDSYVAHIWTNSWVDRHWWESPLIWNARYWTIGLTVLFIALWLYLYFLS